MPVTGEQKKMACMALAMHEGKMPMADTPAGKMAKSMSKEKLTEWCKGPMMTPEMEKKKAQMMKK